MNTRSLPAAEKRVPQLCVSLVIAGLFLSGCSSTRQDLQALRYEALPGDPPALSVPEGPLDLQACVARALAVSDDVALLAASADVAIENMGAVGDHRDPQLRLTYGEGSSEESGYVTVPGLDRIPESLRDSDGDGSGYRAALRFFPANPWGRSARVSTAEATARAAVADLRHALWLAGAQVRELFVALAGAEHRVKDFEALVALHARAVATVREGTSYGQSSLRDVMSASGRHLSACYDRDRAMRRRDELRRELARYIAMVPDAIELETATLPAWLPESLGRQVLEGMAFANRQDLVAQTWRVGAAQELCKETRAAGIPWVAFVQGAYSSGSDEETQVRSGVTPGELTSYSVSDGDSTEWAVTAAIDLPIYEWTRVNDQGRLRRAQLQAAEIQEERGRSRVLRDVSASLAEVEGMRQNLERYTALTEPVTRELEQAMRDLEEQLGVASLETFDMRERLLEAERLRHDLEWECREALVRLETVLGAALQE